MLDLILLTFGLYSSIVSVPFILAIFGFRSSEKSVLISMTAGATMFYLWESKILNFNIDIDACLLGILANIIFLFGSHYLLKQPGGWVGVKDQRSLKQHQKEDRRKRQEIANWVFGFSFSKFLQKHAPQNLKTYSITGLFSSFLLLLNIFSPPNQLQLNNSGIMFIVPSVAWFISCYFSIFPILPEIIRPTKNASLLWTICVFITMAFTPSTFLLASNFAGIQAVIFTISAIVVSLLFNWLTAFLMLTSGLYFSALLLQDYVVIDQGLQVQLVLAVTLLGTILATFFKSKEKAYAAQEQLCSKLESDNAYMSDAVQKLNMVKQEFLNNISHEVRTPLHHIRSGAEALFKDFDKYNQEQAKDFAEIIYYGYHNAARYIDNLLDFSNLSANRVELNLAEKDFASIVENSIAEFKQLYLNDSIPEIELFIDTNNLTINCDEDKIKKVIISLLENAMQYGQESLVEIFAVNSSMPDGRKCVKFSIRDYGIGIPENELVNIFGPFVQSSATQKPSGGKGIGLALCQQIISMHHGRIWAENNLGKSGATFNFVIPI